MKAERAAATIEVEEDGDVELFALGPRAGRRTVGSKRTGESAGSGGGGKRSKTSKRSQSLLPALSHSQLARAQQADQRAPVTVSKDEAIVLEDSLEARPTLRPAWSSTQQSSAATSASAPPAAASPAVVFSIPKMTPRAAQQPPAPFRHKPPTPQPTLSFRSPAASSSSSLPPSQSANLAAMRAVLGPSLADSVLLQHLLAANYNCERALSNILDSRNAAPQPQHAQPSSSSAAAHHSHTDLAATPLMEEEDEYEQEAEAAQQQRADAAAQEERKEEEEVIEWERKLLVVLRVGASCTTEGRGIVSLGDSVTFRDQLRDTYHLRQLRAQHQQQMQSRGRRNVKQLRRELRSERKREHRILRFVPSATPQALEIGTLPRSVSDVLVPLFDRKLIDISAVVSAPCPVQFDLLSTIPLLLSVYALPALFRIKREAAVEVKGFLGRVVDKAAEHELNPVDTFLALLSAAHIEPVNSSIREEGRSSSDSTATRQPLRQAGRPARLTAVSVSLLCVLLQSGSWIQVPASTSRPCSAARRRRPRPAQRLLLPLCMRRSWRPALKPPTLPPSPQRR